MDVLCRHRSLAMAVLVCTLVLSGGPRHRRSFAQLDGAGRPTLTYYNAIRSLFDGRFGQARDLFRNSAVGGLRTIDGRWVDAICYHAMIGECFFYQGNFDQALRHYNDALGVYLTNPEWMRRVQFPGSIAPTQRTVSNPPNWARSERTTRPADLPQAFQVLLGNPNNEAVVQRGGVFAPPELRTLHVPEVVRCTALALRRRGQILGPLSGSDPLSAALVSALEGRIGPANHWAQAWIDVQRAMALVSLDNYDEAVTLLQRSLTLAGQYDHPLTPMALFQLADITELSGDYARAEKLFVESSLSAGYFEQIPLVEESLQRAAALRLATTGQPFPELAAANAWATRRRYRHLSATLSRLVAENLAAAGQSKPALVALEKARNSMGRRSEMAAQLAADLDYVAALAHFQQGKPSVAAKLLQSAIKRQQACSRWLYQIQLSNNLYQSNSDTMSPRTATRIYATLLREPTVRDWKTQPLETLASALSPDIKAYGNWLEAAMERRELATAVLIEESLRRHRFAQVLPLGGRLLSLRWLLEADEDRLAAENVELRRDLLLRNPDYAKLSQEARDAKTELAQLPINPKEDSEQQTVEAAAVKLHQTTRKLENLLGQLALRREYCPTIFPPRLTQEELQAALGPKQLVLSFTQTPRSMHVMMLSREKEATWEIKNSPALRKNVVGLLRAIGMHDDNSTLTAKQLRESNWQAPAGALTKQLIAEAQLGFWNRFDELIIVPDGFLWYLPFEALIIDEGDQPTPLISRMMIRYAPSLSLAVTSHRTKSRHEQTVTVLGQMFPREDLETTQEEFTQMQAVVEGLVPLGDRLPAPSGLLRSVWDRLLVLDDVGGARQGPLQWEPARLDDDKGDNSLGRWLRLPWGAPDQVLLPGFHSAAEAGLRADANGDDIFAAVTALMASGTRTVLISRWRTGGQTSFELMREFMQELPHSTAAEAWQRSVQVVRQTEVDPRREPRISHAASAEPIKAEHPFFWAGYLVVDPGEPQDGTDQPRVDPSRADAGV